MYQKNTSNLDPYGIPVAVPAPSGGNVQLGAVQSMKPAVPASTGLRDWPFAFLFVGNVVAIVVLLVMWGIPLLTDSSSKSSTSNFMSSSQLHKVLIFSAVMAVIAAVLSFLMLSFIVKFARGMITFSLWFSVGLDVLFAIYAVVKHQYVLAILATIFALFAICYAFAVRDRIPFAAANLRCGAAAIKKHSSTYCVAFSMLLLQIIWVGVWSFAAFGLSNHLLEGKTKVVNTNGYANNHSCNSNSVCYSNYCYNYVCKEPNDLANLKSTTYVGYFFMLVSFFWGMNVVKNITHATVAGTVATWWYSTDSSGATGASLKRSLTTSFGSICLGSLIVAVLQALRQLAEEARRQGDAAACIAECILGCLQSMMEYFNRWAFIYVGIYGYKFTDAGKAVIGLFHDRGFDTIINDDLVGNALGFAALGVGFLCAGLGMIYTYVDTSSFTFNYANVLVPVLGLCVGIAVSIIPLSVVDSAVATVFVCFAEDPAALQQSHQEHFNELMYEWHRLYPDIMVASATVYPIATEGNLEKPDSTTYVSIAHLKPSVLPPTSGYRDWPFAALFIINCISILVIFFVCGLSTAQDNAESITLSSSEVGSGVGVLLGIFVLAILLSTAIVYLVIKFPQSIIRATLQCQIGFFIVVGVAGAIPGVIVIPIISAFFAIFLTCYYFAVRHRIKFASANLKVAAVAIWQIRELLPITYLLTFVQLAWFLLWLFAFLGILQLKQQNEAAPIILMTISLLWGINVFKNVNHTVIAGSVGSWWHATQHDQTSGAIKRSLTTSFGSICLGSLIVAILDTIKQLLQGIIKNKGIAAIIAECLLGYVVALVEYYNYWAFVYVGIYGYNFCDAGRAVMQLFRTRGFTAIINDDLIQSAFAFTAFIVGLLSGGIGTGLAIAFSSDIAAIVGISSFLLGIGIAVIALGVVHSAVATVFVCFAEHPEGLRQIHPEYFNLLLQGWHQMYPTVMVEAGYPVPPQL